MLKVINELDDFYNLVSVVSQKLKESTNLVMLLVETSESCTLEDINKAAQSLGLGGDTLQEIKQESDLIENQSLSYTENASSSSEEPQEIFFSVVPGESETSKNKHESRNEDNCLPDHFMIQTMNVKEEKHVSLKPAASTHTNNVNEETASKKELTALEKKRLRRAGFCDDCGQQKSDIHQHRRLVHEGRKPKPRTDMEGFCEECNQKYAHLKHHIRTVHEKRPKVWTCPFCNAQIEGIYNNIFFDHRQTCEAKYTGITDKYSCEKCNEKFATLKIFKRHKNKCFGIKTKQNPTIYPCTYEGCTFVNKKKLGLENHINVVHLNLPKRTFPCEICGKVFSAMANVTIHIRKEHLKERPYECTECGSKFATSSLLNQHKKIHSDVLSFVCPYCGKAFKQNSVLYRHKLSCSFKS